MEGKQSLLHAVSSAPCCVPTNHTGRMRCWICPLFSCSTLSPRCALWFLYLLLEAQGWGRHCRQDVTLNLKRGRAAGGGGCESPVVNIGAALLTNLFQHLTNSHIGIPCPHGEGGGGDTRTSPSLGASIPVPPGCRDTAVTPQVREGSALGPAIQLQLQLCACKRWAEPSLPEFTTAKGGGKPPWMHAPTRHPRVPAPTRCPSPQEWDTQGSPPPAPLSTPLLTSVGMCSFPALQVCRGGEGGLSAVGGGAGECSIGGGVGFVPCDRDTDTAVGMGWGWR